MMKMNDVIIKSVMDGPCSEWVAHVQQRWSGLPAAQKNLFDVGRETEDDHQCVQHIIREEDLSALSQISKRYPVRKSPEDVAKYKERGNERFKKKDYTSAVLFYTKGASHAGKNTEQLALCYANRSAALFHLALYENCLMDIQRAFDEGYPSHLHCKLTDRRTKCKDEIEKLERFKKSTLCPTPQTKEPKNENTSLSSVSFDLSPERGRCLLAAGNLSAGEVLFEDEAYSVVLIPDCQGDDGTFGTEHRRCHRCLRQSLSMVPCATCSYAMYCGESCEREAWRQYHQWECPSGSELLAMGIFTHLSVRITLKAGMKEIQRARERCCNPVHEKTPQDASRGSSVTAHSVGDLEEHKLLDHSRCFHGSSYLGIYSLLPHAAQHPSHARFLLAFTIAALSQQMLTGQPSLNTWLGPQPENGRAEPGVLGVTALRHVLQLRCNAQAVTALQTQGDDHLAVMSTAEVRIGTAVFPVLSLLNHSCNPNTSISFSLGARSLHSESPVSLNSGVTLTVRLCRDITAGHELFHCYGPHYSRMNVKERQHLLIEQYFFKCGCEACNLEVSMATKTQPSSGIKCEKCGGCLQTSGAVHECLKSSCRYRISSKELQGRLQIVEQYVKRSLELLENQQVGSALRLLKEASIKADVILMKTHPLQGEIADTMARAYATSGDWKQAAVHMSDSVDAVRVQFGADSVELGRQLFKLTQLHFNGGEEASARSVISSARRLLSLHCDALCEELQELMIMEACLKTAA